MHIIGEVIDFWSKHFLPSSSCVDSLISPKQHFDASYVLNYFCNVAEATEHVLDWQVKQLNKVLCSWLPGRLQERRQGY